MTYLIVRKTTASRETALFVLALAAGNVYLWRWSGTVMETTLAYLFVVLIAGLTLRLMQSGEAISGPPIFVLGILVGLGTLVRFEIGLLLPLSLLAVLSNPREGKWKAAFMVVGFASATAPWIMFAHLYFGSVLPTTFAAKTGGLHLFNSGVVTSIATIVLTAAGLSLVFAVYEVTGAFRKQGIGILTGSRARQVLYLVSWPVLLFVFYYLKTNGLQAPARYFLPGMATWPIAAGMMVSFPPWTRARSWLAISTMVGTVLVGLAVNYFKVQPQFRSFNGEYRAAMSQGAEFLRDHCNAGDSALIVVDIGIMSREGIGACSLLDGGGLATPRLHGMTLWKQLALTKPSYLVEVRGLGAGDLIDQDRSLSLMLSRSYADHGISTAGDAVYLNIYRTR